MPNDFFFSIVIPVFNNTSSISTLLEKLTVSLAVLGKNYEVVFVDDCSNDDSLDTLMKLSASHSNIKLVSLKKNLGQWEATLIGMACASGEYIVTIDADLQYDAADISKLFRHLLEKDFLLVYGIPLRMLTGMGGLRNRLQNLILKKSLTSSFKILHRSVIFDNQNQFIALHHFEAHEKIHVLSEKKGWIQVATSNNRRGGFRSNLVRNMNIMLTYLPEYNLRLLHPLTLCGIVLMLGSLLPLSVIFLTVNSIKILLFSGIIFLAGLLWLTTGIKWKMKYKRLLNERKQLLLSLRAKQ